MVFVAGYRVVEQASASGRTSLARFQEDRIVKSDHRKDVSETSALLELIALGNRDVEAGRTRPLRDVVARLRAKNAIG